MPRNKTKMEETQQTKLFSQKMGELVVRLSLGYQKKLSKPLDETIMDPGISKLGNVTYRTKLVPTNQESDLGLNMTCAAANVIQYGCVKLAPREKLASLTKNEGKNNIPVMNRLAFLCTAMAGAVPDKDKDKAESPGFVLDACRKSCFIANLVTLRAPCLLLSRSLENVSAYINFRCYELCKESVGMVGESFYKAAYGPMMMGALGALLGGVTYVASTAVIHPITRIVSNVIDFIYNPIETAQRLAKTVDEILYSVPVDNLRTDEHVPTTTWPIFKVAAVSVAACVAIAVCVVVPPLLLAVAPNLIAPVAAVVTPVVSAALHTTVSSWTAMAVAGGSLPVLSTLLSGFKKLAGYLSSNHETSFEDKAVPNTDSDDKSDSNTDDPAFNYVKTVD